MNHINEDWEKRALSASPWDSHESLGGRRDSREGKGQMCFSGKNRICSLRIMESVNVAACLLLDYSKFVGGVYCHSDGGKISYHKLSIYSVLYTEQDILKIISSSLCHNPAK